MTEVEAYHEMYLPMARAAEQAIRLLVEAQQACETLYMERRWTVPKRRPSGRSKPVKRFTWSARNRRRRNPDYKKAPAA